MSEPQEPDFVGSYQTLFGDSQPLRDLIVSGADPEAGSRLRLLALLTGLNALKPIASGEIEQILRDDGGSTLISVMNGRGVGLNEGAENTVVVITLEALRKAAKGS